MINIIIIKSYKPSKSVVTDTISSSTSMYRLSNFTEHPCNGTDRNELLD